MNRPEKNLRNTIKGNAGFSFLSGISLLIFAKMIAGIMNIVNSNVLIIVGIGLLLFAALLLYNAYKKELDLKQVKLIIIQDWIWVIGSSILLIADPFSISLVGNVIIAIVAVIVMLFAIMQTKVLRQVQKEREE